RGGPESRVVAAKMAVRGSLTAAVLAARIDAAERRVREAVPIADTIYLEPDIYSPDREDAADPSIQVVRRSRRTRPGRRPSSGSPSALPARALPGAALRALRAQGAQRALLLEVERPSWRGRHVPGAPPQIGDRRADRRLREHPQPERERGWRDVIAPLHLHRRGDGGQVFLGELPVRGPPSRGPVSQSRQQAQVFPITEHPRGHAEALCRFRDPHGTNLTLSCKKPHSKRAR